MTQEEINELDVQVSNGEIDDEIYYGSLRDEVMRLHPELDTTDIENMLAIQLKTLAVETAFFTDRFETKPPEEAGIFNENVNPSDHADELNMTRSESDIDAGNDDKDNSHDSSGDHDGESAIPTNGEPDSKNDSSGGNGKNEETESDGKNEMDSSNGKDKEDGFGGEDVEKEKDNNDKNDDGMIWWNFQWVPAWFLGLNPSVLSDEKGEPVFVMNDGNDTMPALDYTDVNKIEYK